MTQDIDLPYTVEQVRVTKAVKALLARTGYSSLDDAIQSQDPKIAQEARVLRAEMHPPLGEA
jgi:hypothetical protein